MLEYPIKKYARTILVKSEYNNFKCSYENDNDNYTFFLSFSLFFKHNTYNSFIAINFHTP